MLNPICPLVHVHSSSKQGRHGSSSEALHDINLIPFFGRSRISGVSRGTRLLITYIHTYLHTYIPTYLHAYIHIYTNIQTERERGYGSFDGTDSLSPAPSTQPECPAKFHFHLSVCCCGEYVRHILSHTSDGNTIHVYIYICRYIVLRPSYIKTCYATLLFCKIIALKTLNPNPKHQ